MKKKTGQKHQATTATSTSTTVLPTPGTSNEFVIRDVRNNGSAADDADADDEEMNSGFYNYLRSSNGDTSHNPFRVLIIFKLKCKFLLFFSSPFFSCQLLLPARSNANNAPFNQMNNLWESRTRNAETVCRCQLFSDVSYARMASDEGCVWHYRRVCEW